MPSPVARIAAAATFPNDKAAPLAKYTGTRINATAGVASSAEAALPLNAKVIEIRCTDSIWIRFGATGMGAAAADANSQLVPPGEKIQLIPYSSGTTVSTHFRVLRVGSADVLVQIEVVETQS